MSSLSSNATREYENADADIEMGQEEEAVDSSSSSSTDTPSANQDNKHHGWLVIGTTALLLLIGFTTLSSKYTLNKSAISSIQQQTRNLIDLSSWASILGSTPSPPTKSPTNKPIIDMSDWHNALGPTPPVSYIVVHIMCSSL